MLDDTRKYEVIEAKSKIEIKNKMQSSLVSMKSENDVRTKKAVNFDLKHGVKMQRWYSTDQVVMRPDVDKVIFRIGITFCDRLVNSDSLLFVFKVPYQSITLVGSLSLCLPVSQFLIELTVSHEVSYLHITSLSVHNRAYSIS